MSKKIQHVLIGVAGTIVVLIIKAIWPDLPDGTIEWAIGVVGGVPALGAVGQALADGMSRGLTSSNADKILESGTVVKNSSAPAAKEQG